MDDFLRLLQDQTGVIHVPPAVAAASTGGRHGLLSPVNHQSYEGADARWRRENLEPAVVEVIERHTPCDRFLYDVAQLWFASDWQREEAAAGGGGIIQHQS